MEGVESLLTNLTGKTHRTVWQGRNYIVAPLTLIVPGVLNGSKGSLYYPPEEIGKDPQIWNHVPLVVYHPTSNGQHVSARSPDILEKYGVGHVFHAGINNQGKLVAQGWFDEEKTKAVDSRVYQRLLKNQPIELSTGLFTDNELAENGATDGQGRAYQYIARNYRPDHLAILPDQVGACSLNDGCGVMVNSVTPAQRKSALTLLRYALKEVLTNAGLPSEHADVDPEKACEILRDGTAQGHALTEAQKGMFGAICGKRKETRNQGEPPTAPTPPQQSAPAKPGTPAKAKKPPKVEASAFGSAEAQTKTQGAMNEKEVYEENCSKMGMTGNTWSDAAREAALEARRAGAKTKNVEAKTETEKANAASEHAAKNDVAGTHSDAAIAHSQAAAVHMRANDLLRAAGDTRAADAHLKAYGAHSKAALAHDKRTGEHFASNRLAANQPRHEDGQYGPKSGAATKQTHSAATKGYGSPGSSSLVQPEGKTDKNYMGTDRDVVDRQQATDFDSNYKEEDKNDLEEDAENTDAVDDTIQVTTKNQRSYNQGRTRPMTREQKLERLTANCACQEEAAALNKLTDETLDALYEHKFVTNEFHQASFADVTGGGKGKSDQAGGEEEQEEGDTSAGASRKGQGLEGGTKTMNRKYTFQELLANGDSETREILTNAKKITDDRKVALVKRLIANVSDNKQRTVIGNRFMKKTIGELEELVSLIPPAVNTQQATPVQQFPNYLGAGNPFESPAANVEDDNDVLVMPTLNFQEIVAEQRKEGVRKAQ